MQTELVCLAFTRFHPNRLICYKSSVISIYAQVFRNRMQFRFRLVFESNNYTTNQSPRRQIATGVINHRVFMRSQRKCYQLNPLNYWRFSAGSHVSLMWQIMSYNSTQRTGSTISNASEMSPKGDMATRLFCGCPKRLRTVVLSRALLLECFLLEHEDLVVWRVKAHHPASRWL